MIAQMYHITSFIHDICMLFNLLVFQCFLDFGKRVGGICSNRCPTFSTIIRRDWTSLFLVKGMSTQDLSLCLDQFSNEEVFNLQSCLIGYVGYRDIFVTSSRKYFYFILQQFKNGFRQTFGDFIYFRPILEKLFAKEVYFCHNLCKC